jgi:hypothetical protein
VAAIQFFMRNPKTMKILLITLLFIFQIRALQAQDPDHQYDFSTIDPTKIDVDKLRSKMDSSFYLYTTSVDSISHLVEWVRSKKNIQKYGSLDFGWGLNYSTLEHLNEGLINSGMQTFSEKLYGFHFGVTIRGKRFLFYYGLEDCRKQIVQNNNVKVEVDASSADFTFGFDVLNKPRFQFYPNVTLSFQSLELAVYSKDANSIVNDIPGLLANYTHTELEKNTIALNYGVQADYHLVYTKRRGGIIIGIRCGLTNDLGKGKWKINNEKSTFQSDDRFRNSYVTAIIKFYMKMEGRDD